MEGLGTYAAAAGGNVGYFHAGGIDRPLVITKNGESIVPHQNWRGQFARGTYADGAKVGQRSDCTVYPARGCTPIQWPGERTTARHELEPDNNIQNWFGSLVHDMRDASGQMYRRNRYYDPQTGQFTQPDPIGLAGGFNAYGFAEGDPVSYDDRYGLAAQAACPPLCNELNPRHLEIEVERAESAAENPRQALGLGLVTLLGGAVALVAPEAGAVFLSRFGPNAARAAPAAAASGSALFRNGERVQRFFKTAQGRVEMLFQVNIQGSTLHLERVSIMPQFAERLNLGNPGVQQGLRTLMAEARAQGFETLRLTGLRISGANPGRIQSLLINLKK